MAIPVTIPYSFANATTTQNLSYLDANYNALANGLNGLSNGTSQISISSISATGNANATTYLRGDGSWATVSGGGGSGTVTSVDVNGGTTGLTASGGPVTTSGNITLSGTLVVSNGGTGLSNIALNNVILGNNTGSVKVVAPGASGNVLTSNGSAWISSVVSTTQGAKAWVNFNGTLTTPITPRASYNVSSVTRNSVGNYTLNFTTALADANYSVTASANFFTGNSWVAAPYSGGTKSTSAVQIATVNNGSFTDLSDISATIFGN
jgi:hypothetical protein